ncbi:MAG: hypothetical protein R3F62_05165 [Planctomycetota bacterium]
MGLDEVLGDLTRVQGHADPGVRILRNSSMRMQAVVLVANSPFSRPTRFTATISSLFWAAAKAATRPE